MSQSLNHLNSSKMPQGTNTIHKFATRSSPSKAFWQDCYLITNNAFHTKKKKKKLCISFCSECTSFVLMQEQKDVLRLRMIPNVANIGASNLSIRY